MPNTTENKDIQYQPPTKGYSYSNPNPNGNPKKRLNIFFTLGLETIGLLFLFFLFLAVSNYFNILSLSALYPNQLGFLPQKKSSTQQQKSIPADTEAPVFLPQRNSWVANGTLYSYNDNQIEIKVGKKIVKLEFSYQNSAFYKSETAFSTDSTQSATTMLTIPHTLYDLDQKENLGKKVNVRYVAEKRGGNIIQTIILFD